MGVGILKIFLTAAITLASTSAFASSTAWQDRATLADMDRLDDLPQIRFLAVDQTHSGFGQGDARVIDRVMKPESRTIPRRALLGTWKCRQIKLGGISSYMVYQDWFRCRIRRDRGGLVFEKLNGSQLMAGRLYEERGAWVYLGASWVKGEGRHSYSGRAPSLGGTVRSDDQIGLLTGIGNDHLRLEIPATQESLLDVVELVR
jgi:hypothetical protein